MNVERVKRLLTECLSVTRKLIKDLERVARGPKGHACTQSPCTVSDGTWHLRLKTEEAK